MATAGASQALNARLSLSIHCEDQNAQKGKNLVLALYLKSNLIFLNQRIHSKKEFECITVVDVTYEDGSIFLVFGIYSELHLEYLYECLKVVDNTFSRWISQYLLDQLGLRSERGTRITCTIWMQRSYFYLKRAELCVHEERQGTSVDDDRISRTAQIQGQAEEQNLLYAQGNVRQTSTQIEQSTASPSQPGSDPSRKDEAYKETSECLVKKRFLLLYPEQKDVVVKWIKIVSDNKHYNGEMLPHQYNIYGFTVQVPENELYPSEYYYMCHIKIVSTVQKFKSMIGIKEPIISRFYRVRDCEVKRDVWIDRKRNVRPQDVNIFHELYYRIHLMDIIFHCQTSCGLSDCCLQIENLTHTKLPLPNAAQVIKSLGSLLQQHESICCVLFSVAVGNLLDNPTCIRTIDVISSNIADYVIKSLADFKLDDLPTSCKRYIHQTCLALLSVALNTSASNVMVLNTCYEFYGETFIANWIKHKRKYFKNLCNTENQIALIEFCIKSYKSALHNSPGATETLVYLLRNLPFQLALTTYTRIETYDDGLVGSKGDLPTTLHESICVKIDAELTEIMKCPHSKFLRLKSLWECVSDVRTLKEVFKSKFEDAFICCIEMCTANEDIQDEDIPGLIKTLELLNVDSEMPTKLIELIMTSANKHILELFITLSEKQVLKDTFIKVTPNKFREFSQRYCSAAVLSQTQTAETELKQIITAISKLLNCSLVQSNTHWRITLVSVIETELGKWHLNRLLSNIDFFSNLSTSTIQIADHFLQHVRKQLQETVEGPDVLLGMMKTASGKLIIDTKLSAEVVCVILDIYCKESKDRHAEEQFGFLVDLCQFWLTIFQCDGGFFEMVRNNKSYIYARNCIDTMSNHFCKYEIHYDFILKMENHPQRAKDAKRLLKTSISYELVEEYWSNAHRRFRNEIENLELVYRVIHKITDNEVRMGAYFSFIADRILEVINGLKSGKITANECCDANFIWQEIAELPHLCKGLDLPIQSSVFWNACKDTVYSECVKRYRMHYDEDPLCYVPFVFSEGDFNDDCFENTSLCIFYMKTLFEVGCSEYRDMWVALRQNKNFTMKQIYAMFGQSPDISNEIALAERVLQLFGDKSFEETLTRIYFIDSVKDTVHAIGTVLEVFDIPEDDTYKTAVTSFDKLLQGAAESKTFMQVQNVLSTVFIIVDSLSEKTKCSMLLLRKASTLVEFLKTIVDEDIRNLIDAVEDISEQQVQESTVSALIEVKQYLYPLLIFPADKSCSEFLMLLEKQTKLHGCGSHSLPTKIEDCVQNVHNLKCFYKGVANRSEQTKEIVKSILQKGIFCFQLCNDFSSVEFYAHYKQLKVKKIRTQSTLIDLRSRALLIVNSDRPENIGDRFSRTELVRFLSYIDMCIEITDVFFALHIAGHVEFMTIRENIKPLHLSKYKERLDATLETWQTALEYEREEHYLMNYLHGNQLHVIYKYLEKNEEQPAVPVILTFIHPNLNASIVKAKYEEEKNVVRQFTNTSMLHCIGYSLHSAYQGLSLCRREINCNKDRLLASFVQSEKVMVAHLDEGSLHTIRTLLALYMNTTQCLPESSHVLLCTRETSWIEVQLLIQRCVGAYMFYGVKTLFCIAHIEVLPVELQFRLVETLRQLPAGSNFLLAVIFRGSRNHHFVDELSDCVAAVKPVTDNIVRDIFKHHCSKVYTVTSELAGVGKTSYIRTVAHKENMGMISFHVSGQMRKKLMLERLNALHVRHCHVLHIDIADVDEPSVLDTFLFELVVLQYMSSSRIAVKLETQSVFIEIANTIHDFLRKSLLTTMLFQKVNIDHTGIDNLIVSKDMHSPVQTVCHYIRLLEKGTLDTNDVSFGKPLSAKKCKALLLKFMFRNHAIAFPALLTALNVLADQLKKMTFSSFFKVGRLREMVENKSQFSVKSKLLCAMMNASVEFATLSVPNCRHIQMSSVISNDAEQDNQIKATTDVHHHSLQHDQTDGMIRWEDSNHLMFVFHNQNIHTLSALYRHLSEVPNDIKSIFERQMNKGMVDFSTLEQHDLLDCLQKIARINPLPFEHERLEEFSTNYVLTPDNLLKMVLMILRIKANIPVLVMGETGCGKTSLIRYLASVCEVEFVVLNIHAGILEDDIVKCVTENNVLAISNKERWLFLDEINTSDSIGLLSDIICHRSCLGNELSPNLIVMGACNPYKLRTTKAISTAGLEGKVKTDELSRLVYRVLPLPEIMVDYVWDFGSLHEKDEELYIRRMLHGVFQNNERYQDLFTCLLSVSQTFVRIQEESHYVVSLRDVQRCKLLSKWFLEILPKKTNIKKCKMIDVDIKAMILALAHCYQSRFSNKIVRKEYRSKIGEVFLSYNIKFDYCQESFINIVIKEEQADFLHRMKLPPGIACNNALMENVFVILVCIFNRIPIFVVGKPGCSKSLAMLLIKSNLRGKDSEDDFFKQLPQLHCVSFQGSESSTSDGIVKVFKKAENYQESNSSEYVLSVVILDEIGLAGVSRFNPLKVLHSLLEPDGQSQPNVAVVGLSNWALDASKMNRAIHLSRPDMDEDELFETAVSISESFLNRNKQSTSLFGVSAVAEVQTFENIYRELKGMAAAYFRYVTQLRFKSFHGLRDYYSLVKYVSRKFADSDSVLSERDMADIILNGIARNFGGLPEEIQFLYDVFKLHIPSMHIQQIPVLEIVKENVTDPIARHLMLITTGESVLGILEQKLNNVQTKTKEIIFGSKFEEDLTDDYNYRILSKIILCMEQGIILVLKDLDSIYGSLYDMLNQNYTLIGKKKSCRVALGPYSNPICHVDENFRCIVLIDECKLQRTDPPFLNRFEKQYLRFSDIIQEKHARLIAEITHWIDQLSLTKGKDIKIKDLFAIQNKDLIASLVLKNESGSEGVSVSVKTEDDSLSECKEQLLMIMKPETVLRQKMISDSTTFNHDNLIAQYFKLPIHNGLEHFMEYQLETMSDEIMNEGILTVIFTNSNVHTKIKCTIPRIRLQVEKLGAFKSEKQLTSRVQMFWNDASKNVLIIQCNAKEEEHHVLLSKLIVERCRRAYNEQSKKLTKHVYIVMHLDRRHVANEKSSQLNFLSDWSLAMLDCLEIPRIPLPTLYQMPLFEVIYDRKPLLDYLREELLWAFSRIKYETHGRNVESIFKAIVKIENSSELLEILENEIFDWLRRHHTDLPGRYWPCKVACNTTLLNSTSGFVDALEQYIMNKIRTPFAKLIYQIELTSMLDSFFLIPNHEGVVYEKRKAWVYCLRNKCSISLNNILDVSGPECYMCSTNDCQLRMPCSKQIYEAIETTRADFMDMLREYKLRCLLDDDEVLPADIYDEVLSQQEMIMIRKLPDFNDFTYPTWDIDYFDDFCSLTTESLVTGTDKIRRRKFLKQILNRHYAEYSGDSFSYVIRLHTLVWAHYDNIRAEMVLIDNCMTKLPECESDVLRVLSSMDEKMCNNEIVNVDVEENNCNKGCKEQATLDQWKEDGDLNESNRVDIMPLENKKMICPNIGEFPCMTNDIDINMGPPKQEQTCMDVSERLVNCVCKKLLPTNECIKLHGGISNWLLVANTTVSLAAQVSRYPYILYSLKTCAELTQELIIPLNLPENLLECIGEMLLEKALDSDVVFDAVMSIIDVVMNVKTSSCDDVLLKCSQTLSCYFVRCISSNPWTMILDKLFGFVVEKKLATKYIWMFKVPLETILQTVDEELFKTLFYIDFLGSEDSCVLGQVNSDSGMEILKAVDKMIVCLFDDGRFDSPILTLLVDILETKFNDVYFSNMDDYHTTADIFYACHKSLDKHKPGLQYLVSVAFCKCFTYYAVKILEHGTDAEETRIINNLNIVFTDLSRYGIHSLISFLFKLLYKNKTVGQLHQFCVAYTEKLEFLKRLQLDYYGRTWFNSVLCMHVKEDVHEQFCFWDQGSSCSFKEKMSLLVKTANKDISGLLQLIAFGLREFYLSQCDKDLDNSSQTQADILLNEVLDSDLGGKDITSYLKCVLGRGDFLLDDFSLVQSSSQQQICVMSFIINLLGLTLAHDTFRSYEGRPILAKALLDPESLRACVIPGFIRHTELIADAEEFYVGICQCEHKVYVRIKSDISKCVICDSDINLSFERIKCNHTDLEHDAQSETCCRLSESNMLTINIVTYHVLQILIKASVLGSVALGYTTPDKVSVSLRRPFAETSDVLTKEVFGHWNKLEKMVNTCHNETTMLLHAVLLKAQGLLYESCISCNSIEETNDFEERFDKIVVEIFGGKTKSLHTMYNKHNLIHPQLERGRGSFKYLLFEIEDIHAMPREESILNMPSLYRRKTHPSKENFVFELNVRNHQFPLVETVLRQENMLSLPCHILSILFWHSATIANASYMIRRQDCLRMSAQEFLYFKQDTMKKDVLKKRFVAFTNSWEILKNALKDTTIGRDMTRIHSQTKMVDCLLLDENSVVYRVLMALIAIQNRFLDSVARIAHSSKSLLSRYKENAVAIPCVSLTEVKTEDLLNVELDWNDILTRESQCNLLYAHGTQVQYDFYRIEEYIANVVVSRKKFISAVSNVPKIIFVDEMYLTYAALVKEIKEHVQQKIISSDIYSGIISRNDEDPSMTFELLNHLGVVMTIMKRSKADPEETLVEFVDCWKSMLFRKFPKELLPKPESSVKLCHVVALSELLEELCAETIKDGLDDQYIDKLDTPLRKHLLVVIRDENVSSILLKVLKRFTYRCLHSKTADPNQSIHFYLADESFWPIDTFQDNKIHVLEKQYLIADLFPDGMMVRHVSDCLNVIGNEVKKRQEENMKPSAFALRLQSKTGTSQGQRSIQSVKMKAAYTRIF